MELQRLRRDAVEWRQVEDDVIALDLRRSTYLAPNRSPTALWQLLAAGTTEPELVTRLAETCEIDKPRADRDVGDFLRPRALVTGGGGSIGSHPAAHLLERGLRVRVLDNFATGQRENLRALAGDLDLVEGDIQSYGRVNNVVALRYFNVFGPRQDPNSQYSAAIPTGALLG